MIFYRMSYDKYTESSGADIGRDVFDVHGNFWGKTGMGTMFAQILRGSPGSYRRECRSVGGDTDHYQGRCVPFLCENVIVYRVFRKTFWSLCHCSL